MIKRLARLPALLLLGLATLALPLGSAVQAEPHDAGPLTLMIFYRSKVADRPAFKKYLGHTEVPRLKDWQAKGILKKSLVLFNPYVDSETWDAMTILTFPNFAAVEKWMAIEESFPGGLDREGLALGTPFQTYSTDLKWSEGDSDESKGIYYVINYSTGNAENADKWDLSFLTYGIPQMHRWVRDSSILRYGMYNNRYDSGDKWDEMLVLQYKDMQALGQRELEMARVRGELAKDPNFKPLVDHTHAFHTVGNDVIAVPVTGDK